MTIHYTDKSVTLHHRRRNPVEAVKNSGEDGGLFDLLDDGGAA